MRSVQLVIVALTLTIGIGALEAKPVQLDEVTGLVEKAWKKWRTVKDYTGIFIKQERVDGDLLEKETIFNKFRVKPLSVYMKWIKDPHEGRESLYVKGKNDGEVKVNAGLINVNLDPRGSMVMKENRHTVFEAGIGNIIKLIRADMVLAKETGIGTFEDLGMKTYEGMRVQCYRSTFPPDKVKKGLQAKKGKFYSADITICMDKRFMPVVIESKSAKGKLLEYYVNKDVKFNQGLTDKDFDPDHDEYDF